MAYLCLKRVETMELYCTGGGINYLMGALAQLLIKRKAAAKKSPRLKFSGNSARKLVYKFLLIFKRARQ